MTLDGVMSLSPIINLQNTNASIIVKVLGGISFYVITENWKHLRGKLVISSFVSLGLANMYFVAQYITDCRSVVSEYITRASRSLYIRFMTDLQPGIYCANKSM